LTDLQIQRQTEDPPYAKFHQNLFIVSPSTDVFTNKHTNTNKKKLEMWANAQRDGRLPNIGGALCSTPQFG